jgi:hypothetical protein
MLCTLNFRLPAGYDPVGRSIFKIEKTAGVDPTGGRFSPLKSAGPSKVKYDPIVERGDET